MSYKTYITEKTPETAANTMICLINQANLLLNALLRQLEERFLKEGGFTEALYKSRSKSRVD